MNHQDEVDIAVAMSGGVDSSVAAALLRQQGHRIVGFTMQLWNQRRRLRPDADPQPSRCCSLDDVYDARSVAADLDFPFYVINLESDFERDVVRPFVQSYLEGETPIPCVACNSRLKFSKLVDLATSVGARAVATGHYARSEYNASSSRFMLKKGLDTSKDQSYFLFEMTQDQLSRARFPLGGLSKPEVRAVARKLGLEVAEKAESQEICFVPDGNYARFVEDYARNELKSRTRPGPGPITDRNGVRVGEHSGLHKYTVGQRRGIGVASAQPLYVVDIDVPMNRLVVGARNELYGAALEAGGVNWIAGVEPDGPVRAAVRIRYRAAEAQATVTPVGEGRVRVEFDSPQPAITPGQAAVFYNGDEVLGGGWIRRGQR